MPANLSQSENLNSSDIHSADSDESLLFPKVHPLLDRSKYLEKEIYSGDITKLYWSLREQQDDNSSFGLSPEKAALYGKYDAEASEAHRLFGSEMNAFNDKVKSYKTQPEIIPNDLEASLLTKSLQILSHMADSNEFFDLTGVSRVRFLGLAFLGMCLIIFLPKLNRTHL